VLYRSLCSGLRFSCVSGGALICGCAEACLVLGVARVDTRGGSGLHRWLVLLVSRDVGGWA